MSAKIGKDSSKAIAQCLDLWACSSLWGGLMWHPRAEQQLATSGTAPPLLLQLSNTCCPHQFFLLLLPFTSWLLQSAFFLMKSLTGASKGRCTEVRKRGEWCLPVFQVKIANTHICIHIGKAKQEGKSIALVKTHFQIWMKLVISRASQKPLFPDLISSLNVTLAASQKIGDEQDLQRSPNPSLCQTEPRAWDSPAAGNASSFFWLSAVFGLEKMQWAAPAFFPEVTSPLKTSVPKDLQHKQDRLHSSTLFIFSSAFPSSRGMGRVGRDDRVWGEVSSQIQSCLHNSFFFFFKFSL